MTTHTPKGITITRIFDAPVEKVWAAWTDPEQMKKWWGPQDFTAPVCKIDFRVGGKFLAAMHGPAGTEFDKDMWSTGIYKEIIPLKKIVSTDNFADAEGNIISPKEYGMPGEWPEEMLITVTFEEVEGPEGAPFGGDKTKLTLEHIGHPVEMEDMAKAGWNQSLDKLAVSLQ